MPKYSVLYFNSRGRAEPIRWMLAVTKEPFNDVRFDKETEWPERKPNTRYGKVPVLFIDDKALSQSVTICRYLGETHGMHESDPWLSAEGNEVADAVHDLVPPAAQILYKRLAGEVEEAKKMAEEFQSGVLKATLVELEKKLVGKAWFCGKKMTWVDIFASCYLSQLAAQNEDVFKPYPLLRALIDKVLALPEIQKWLKERPATSL